MTIHAAPPPYRSLEWIGDDQGYLRILDQTQLPVRVCYRECRTVADVWQAIRSLQVRGAPAIGIAAAYGVVLAVRDASAEEIPDSVHAACRYLSTSRPTAVNLFWALERMQKALSDCVAESVSPGRMRSVLLEQAHAIRDEDAAMCRAIAITGADLMQDGMGVLTHCNTGALATAEYGTALGCLIAAWQQGKRFHVFAGETRPLLQGSRLTAWELQQWGIPVTVICDSMAAWIMKRQQVQLVLVGADRIAANGDTANKIGTYSLAVLAQAHGIPFYVAAPSSSFDLSLPGGESIPLEHRDPAEITCFRGLQIAPPGVAAHNPAFDVTPASLVTGLITERGLIRPVTAAAIARLLSPRSLCLTPQ
jgi:methylthioribose-1-phosphate isomerase